MKGDIIAEKPDGWWLEMTADPAMLKDQTRTMVTSDLLGTATALVVGLMVQAIHDDDRILVRRRRTRRVDKQEETACFSAPRIQTNSPLRLYLICIDLYRM